MPRAFHMLGICRFTVQRTLANKTGLLNVLWPARNFGQIQPRLRAATVPGSGNGSASITRKRMQIFQFFKRPKEI